MTVPSMDAAATPPSKTTCSAFDQSPTGQPGLAMKRRRIFRANYSAAIVTRGSRRVEPGRSIPAQVLPMETAKRQSVLFIDREILVPDNKRRINKAKTSLRYHWYP
ncbi:hypothetical protein IHQ71_15615 [Rhizobium sp. TH2]|uniref:hypothetical protein n=1 Tax=Rhizobium sp. TH2 TaxID=2775403 RepID=UPI002158449C|nr:hypothetical protein [Rhizobium sp. TH2]UVC06685.1 hypothetical protein IHQ71_15615 [Rhizobium sp. TH2]